IYPLDEERRRWLANRPRPHLARQKAPHVAVGGEPHVACGIDAEAPAPLLDIKPRRFARFMPRIRLRVILLMLHRAALEHAAELPHVGGFRMAYYRHGSGPAIVGDRRRGFLRFLRFFRVGFRGAVPLPLAATSRGGIGSSGGSSTTGSGSIAGGGTAAG